MALILDDRARKVLSRPGKLPDVVLSVGAGSALLRGLDATLSVGWTDARCLEDRTAVRCGEIVVHVDERIALYGAWHPITITARRWGPFVRLRIVDEPSVRQRLVAWERLHPDLRYVSEGRLVVEAAA